ncbi:MAG TPA: ImmA/IrrE family metallo-endopeptidase [Candidatus Acidoferrales bacterium]|nr:ImmA/IrrE family metallo-endopeptidase [Candidatus Acidoferrales bacterium]
MFRRGFKTWAEEISLRVRAKLNLGAAAPLDPYRLADLISVPVLSPDEVRDLPGDCRSRLANDHSDNWSAITVQNGSHHLIVLNAGRAVSRRNSDLAHELAHLILAHEPSMMFVSPGSGIALRTHNKEQEEEANWLAGCLLLPRDALLSIRRRGVSDSQTCEEYGVSPAMFRFRLNASGVDIQLRRAKTWRR